MGCSIWIGIIDLYPWRIRDFVSEVCKFGKRSLNSVWPCACDCLWGLAWGGESREFELWLRRGPSTFTFYFSIFFFIPYLVKMVFFLIKNEKKKKIELINLKPTGCLHDKFTVCPHLCPAYKTLDGCNLFELINSLFYYMCFLN